MAANIVLWSAETKVSSFVENHELTREPLFSASPAAIAFSIPACSRMSPFATVNTATSGYCLPVPNFSSVRWLAS